MIKSFSASLVIPHSSDKFLTTGTTIVAMVSDDNKIGIIASDGRVSGIPIIFDEKFKKVFDCRIGFLGVAGDLSLIQQIVPAFKLALDNICDTRGVLIPASGASLHLMHYYRTAINEYMKHGMQPQIAFLALFWDATGKKIHLYQFEGGAKLSGKKFLSIGSGSTFIQGQQMAYGEIPQTKEKMIERVKIMIKEVGKKDAGTNSNVYYGIIDNGKYTLTENYL